MATLADESDLDAPDAPVYHEHLAPGWMNYIAALGGQRPRPAKRSFTYCELGCREGLTSVILAAANPHARFVGIDANGRHLAYARTLAASCGLKNVTFLEGTAAQALRKELPAFDFIGVHGLWSWVGDKGRGEIVTFVERKLKPGGLLSISYNALPGCAAMLPVRELMAAYANHKGGDVQARLRHGLDYVSFMAENKAAYFEHHPVIRRRFDALMRSDTRHLAHEYLGPNWTPDYFSDVSHRFADTGMNFAGGFPAPLNYMDLTVPERFRQFFETAPNRETFEIHRDFVQDTEFRIDYYAKARSVRVADPWSKGLFDGVVFAPTALSAQSGGAVRIGELDLALHGSLATALRDAMGDGPLTLMELATRPGLSGFPPAELAKGLQFFVLARDVTPGVRKAAASSAGRVSPANRALLVRAFVAGAEEVVLASTVTGGGLKFRTAEAFACAAMIETGRQRAAQWCSAAVGDAMAEDEVRSRVESLLAGIPESSVVLMGGLGL